MSLNIVFINPNASEDVDKFLPRILAEAIINKIDREAVNYAECECVQYGEARPHSA